MQRHLFEHFTSPRHLGFLHLSVKLIDETDSSCPTKREDNCIDTLRPKYPWN